MFAQRPPLPPSKIIAIILAALFGISILYLMLGAAMMQFAIRCGPFCGHLVPFILTGAR